MMRLFTMIALSGLVLGGGVKTIPSKRTYPKKAVYIAFTEGAVQTEVIDEAQRQAMVRQTERANELRTQEIEYN